MIKYDHSEIIAIKIKKKDFYNFAMGEERFYVRPHAKRIIQSISQMIRKHHPYESSDSLPCIQMPAPHHPPELEKNLEIRVTIKNKFI